MSVFKTTFSRALPIIIGSDAVIPTPYILTNGQTTDPGNNSLIDNDRNFLELGIKVGDVVYAASNPNAATIISVSENVLGLNVDLFPNGDEKYIIYQQSAASGIGNQGCSVWVEKDSDVEVITIGGDDVVFYGVKGGTVLPVQVIQVVGSSEVQNLIALW